MLRRAPVQGCPCISSMEDGGSVHQNQKERKGQNEIETTTRNRASLLPPAGRPPGFTPVLTSLPESTQLPEFLALWSFWEASFWERLGQRAAGSLLEEVVRVTVQPGARPDGRVPRGRCMPGWSPAPSR